MAEKSPRQLLEEALEKVWKTDEFEAIRAAYDRAAGDKYTAGTFAACLAKKMEEGAAGRDAYRECAKEAKLGEAYRKAWPARE